MVTRRFLLDVIWEIHFPNRICCDKSEFLKRQKMLPFWKNRHLRRDDVLSVARKISGEFSTNDIATCMGVDEYPVRAAIVWLVRKRFVERCGQRELLTAGSNEKYYAALYRVRPEATEVDFEALMRALCRF